MNDQRAIEVLTAIGVASGATAAGIEAAPQESHTPLPKAEGAKYATGFPELEPSFRPVVSMVAVEAAGLKRERDYVADKASSRELTDQGADFARDGLFPVPDQLREPLTRKVELTTHLKNYFLARAEQANGAPGEFEEGVRTLIAFNEWTEQAIPNEEWPLARPAELADFLEVEIDNLIQAKRAELHYLSEAQSIADQLYGPSDIAWDREHGRLGPIPIVKVRFDSPRLRQTEQLAVRYWRSLGYRGSCPEGVTTYLINRFFRQPDVPRQSDAAADYSTCERWFKADPEVTHNSNNLTWVNVHEVGHLRGIGHSRNPRSIMYSDERTTLEKPPAGATVRRFERMLDVEAGRGSGD